MAGKRSRFPNPATGYYKCCACETEKHPEEFIKDNRTYSGLASKCRVCYNAYVNYQKEYNPRMRESIARTEAKRRPRMPELRKKWYISGQYGLTMTEYNDFINAHDNRCAICRATSVRALHVDHDHTHHPGEFRRGSNQSKACPECIRGMLCGVCNRYLLPLLEKLPHLQTDFIKEYLQRRPFASPSQIETIKINEKQHDKNASSNSTFGRTKAA